MNLFNISYIVLWIITIFQMVLILLLCRLVAQFLNKFRLNTGEYIREVPSIKPGMEAPMFRDLDQQGQLFRLSDLIGKQVLLLFIDEKCKKCQDIVCELGSISAKQTGVSFIIISNSTQSPVIMTGLKENVIYINSDEVISNYYIRKFPSIVVINSLGIVIHTEEIDKANDIVSILERYEDKLK